VLFRSKLRLADFTGKIKYLVDKNKTEEIEIPYKDYNGLKRLLEKKYKGKIPEKNSLYPTYKRLLNLEKEIYDDYKIETQFLQQDVFSYDDEYIYNINIAYWDIEVLTNNGEFPHAEQANYPINAITLYRTWDKSVALYCLLDSARHTSSSIADDIRKTIEENFKSVEKLEIFLFAKEEELITQFLKDAKDVDVMVGWNSINFDTLYMKTRCDNLELSTNFINSFGYIFETINVVDGKHGMNAVTYYTTKILTLDYIMLIKFYSQKNYPSYSLDYIAKQILKDEDDTLNAKVKVANLNKEYFNNLPNFCLYNVNDVLLNIKIDDKMLFVNLLFKEKMLTRGFTASLLSVNNILDSYIGLKAKENNICCISKLKTANYYKRKIWYIYRRLNLLTDERLELINKLREDNKGYSILVSEEEMLAATEYDSDLSDSIFTEENKDLRLTKLQIPFIWNEDKYPGAYVKIPIKGIYLNAVDLDAEAMYPTSIYTTNNSSDTWIYQVPENIALKYIYERDDLINYIKNNDLSMEVYDVIEDSFERLKNEEILNFFSEMYDKELVLTEVGAVFIPAHLKEGFYRKLIAEPIGNRKKVKKEMTKLKEEKGLPSSHPDIMNLNVTQLVLKIIANSVYGFLGYKNSRLFNVIAASAITINCQFLIRSVAMQCKEITETITKNQIKD
jgi:DNA polymerase elongation subunit (family B)